MGIIGWRDNRQSSFISVGWEEALAVGTVPERVAGGGGASGCAQRDAHDVVQATAPVGDRDQSSHRRPLTSIVSGEGRMRSLETL